MLSRDASDDVHHCVCISVHSSNASGEVSQKAMLSLHVNLEVGENDRNKCLRLLQCDVLVKVRRQSSLFASRSLTSPPKNARGSLGTLHYPTTGHLLLPPKHRFPSVHHTRSCQYQVSDPAFLCAGETNTVFASHSRSDNCRRTHTNIWADIPHPNTVSSACDTCAPSSTKIQTTLPSTTFAPTSPCLRRRPLPLPPTRMRLPSSPSTSTSR